MVLAGLLGVAGWLLRPPHPSFAYAQLDDMQLANGKTIDAVLRDFVTDPSIERTGIDPSAPPVRVERRELDRRDRDRERAAAMRRLSLDELFAILASSHDRDDVWEACYQLRSRYEENPPRFEDALWSLHYQERQLAASILQSLVHQERAEVSLRLLEVSVEGLGNDGISERSLWASNAVDCAQFLLEHGKQQESALMRDLNSADHQRRFLTAHLLGWWGSTLDPGGVCAALVPHLFDNDIAYDAKLAAAALVRLGPQALPYLCEASRRADQQARRILELVIWDIESPPANRQQDTQRVWQKGLGGILTAPKEVHFLEVSALFGWEALNAGNPVFQR